MLSLHRVTKGKCVWQHYRPIQDIRYQENDCILLILIRDFLLNIWNIENNLKRQLLVAKDKIKSTIYHMKFLHLHYGVLTISPASSSSMP